MDRIVIGIAGPPGGGKSTACRALAATLGDACLVHMDSYERMTRQPITEIAAWAARGGDVNELPVPQLAEDLAALKAGRPVREPATGAAIRPARWIVFETQFGRDHRATGRHIDFLAWLDTPRELALARTLRQLAAEALAGPPDQHADRLQWLAGYLDNYQALVRQLLVRQRERVLPGADLVVEGTPAAHEIAATLATAVGRRFGTTA